jgi:probable addiction module antidote protein
MKKTKLKTTPYDPVDYLKTEEDMAAYMEAALEDGHPAVVAMAVGNIARAKGMTKVAKDAGLSRATMYKSFREGGNPEFATVIKVINALGLKFHVEPIHA